MVIEASMHENNISMHEIETFVHVMIFMGDWAVHNFMHGILINEYLWAKFSLPCMEVSFSCMVISILMHEKNIFMPRYFHACMLF